MVPAVSMYTLRKAQREMGATESHQILIWEELMDSKTRWLTPNNTALYTLGFFDLKKDGPTVDGGAARRAGHAGRHVHPLDRRHRHGRPRQGQRGQVPAAASRL